MRGSSAMRVNFFRRLRRRLNRALNDWEFKQRNTILKSSPYILYIDPINICNLRCPLCPTGQGIMPSQGKMPFETFVRIFDQFKAYNIYRVYLYNWGEPLLHPDIYHMIRYVSSRGVMTIMSTNLNAPINAESAAEMVESHLAYLNISMDGFTQSTYEKYRVRGNLDRVMANLRLLVETKRRLQSNLPCLAVQSIAFSHNEHELQQVREFAQQIGVDRFHIEPAILDMSTVATQGATQSLDANKGWMSHQQEHRRYVEDKWRYNPKACHFLWNTAVFRWDGEVFPCCVVYRDEDSFGNIKQEPFAKIWNGPKYRSARSLFGNSPSVDKAPTCCDLCYANEGYKVVDR